MRCVDRRLAPGVAHDCRNDRPSGCGSGAALALDRYGPLFVCRLERPCSLLPARAAATQTIADRLDRQRRREGCSAGGSRHTLAGGSATAGRRAMTIDALPAPSAAASSGERFARSALFIATFVLVWITI